MRNAYSEKFLSAEIVCTRHVWDGLHIPWPVTAYYIPVYLCLPTSILGESSLNLLTTLRTRQPSLSYTVLLLIPTHSPLSLNSPSFGNITGSRNSNRISAFIMGDCENQIKLRLSLDFRHRHGMGYSRLRESISWFRGRIGRHKEGLGRCSLLQRTHMFPSRYYRTSAPLPLPKDQSFSLLGCLTVWN